MHVQLLQVYNDMAVFVEFGGGESVHNIVFKIFFVKVFLGVFFISIFKG